MKSSGHRPRRLRVALRRRPLVAYFVASFAMFWLYLAAIGLIFTRFGLGREGVAHVLMNWIVVLGSWTPNAAGLVVGVAEGREELRKLLRRFVRFKLAAR